MDNDIGARIVALREVKGLSQKELAEKIPVSPPTLSRWEHGVVTPPLSQLERISEILDISLEDIFMGDKAKYDKLRKRLSRVRVVLIVFAVIMVASVAVLFVPKYKIVHKQEEYRDDYGKSLVIYVKPVFYITEKGAYAFGNELAQKCADDGDYEIIEVVFIKTAVDYTNSDNKYYSNLYFLTSFKSD